MYVQVAIMAEQSHMSDIPPDFPTRKPLGAVSGASPKVLLVRKLDGRFEAPVQTEQERAGRWLYCEDLASQLADAAARSKQGKRASWPEREIIEQYLPRLLQTGWTSDEESRWVLRRAAALLGWESPRCCE